MRAAEQLLAILAYRLTTVCSSSIDRSGVSALSVGGRSSLRAPKAGSSIYVGASPVVVGDTAQKFSWSSCELRRSAKLNRGMQPMCSAVSRLPLMGYLIPCSRLCKCTCGVNSALSAEGI